MGLISLITVPFALMRSLGIYTSPVAILSNLFVMTCLTAALTINQILMFRPRDYIVKFSSGSNTTHSGSIKTNSKSIDQMMKDLAQKTSNEGTTSTNEENKISSKSTEKPPEALAEEETVSSGNSS